MSETFVKSFTHLKGRPKADQALPLLQRIASLVKPVMRKHTWVLPVLAEFFPESPNLVGLNVNNGQKILLRLRPSNVPDTFYDEEDLVYTMLHELTHNVHGPHDDKFYKFLSGLEEEYDALKRSGYAGEGFHSKGHRLGQSISHNLPPHIARAKALESAEKRRKIASIMGGSRRLGGRVNVGNLTPRELAAAAAERRVRDDKACAFGAEAQREAEKAARESIEDKVIDLTEDSDSSVEIIDISLPSSKSTSNVQVTPVQEITSHRHRSGKHSASRSRSSLRSAKHSRLTTPPPTPREPASPNGHCRTPLEATDAWTCPRCTLTNDVLALQCAACMLIRPEKAIEHPEDGWTCQNCGEMGIPHEFWSCRFCGSVKTESSSPVTVRG